MFSNSFEIRFAANLVTLTGKLSVAAALLKFKDHSIVSGSFFVAV